MARNVISSRYVDVNKAWVEQDTLKVRRGVVRGKVFVSVTSDSLVIDTGSKEINKAFGGMLKAALQEQWGEASKTHRVSRATYRKRLQALRAFEEGRRTQSLRERYRKDGPRAENLWKWGRDSDRLIGGIRIGLQRSRSQNRSVGRINVPANRFERFTFGNDAQFYTWLSDLRERVPILAGNLDSGIRNPKTRKLVTDTMQTIAGGAVLVGDAKSRRKTVQQLIAKRDRELKKLGKSVLRFALKALTS